MPRHIIRPFVDIVRFILYVVVLTLNIHGEVILSVDVPHVLPHRIVDLAYQLKCTINVINVMIMGERDRKREREGEREREREK